MTFDQNGNATSMAGNLPTISWSGNSYTDGPVESVLSLVPWVSTTSFTAFQGGNEAHSGAAHQTCTLTSDYDAYPSDVSTQTIQSIFNDARVNFQWVDPYVQTPNMHAKFLVKLRGGLEGNDPPGNDPTSASNPVEFGQTIEVDASKITKTAGFLPPGWSVYRAIGVVATHEYGHFLLQQGHCGAAGEGAPAAGSGWSCLQGLGIMAPGSERGTTNYYVEPAFQTFTLKQKPVIQKRCTQLNPTPKKK